MYERQSPASRATTRRNITPLISIPGTVYATCAVWAFNLTNNLLQPFRRKGDTKERIHKTLGLIEFWMPTNETLHSPLPTPPFPLKNRIIAMICATYGKSQPFAFRYFRPASLDETISLFSLPLPPPFSLIRLIPASSTHLSRSQSHRFDRADEFVLPNAASSTKHSSCPRCVINRRIVLTTSE